jgi:ligand-binding sensor domain-containing protein
MTTFGLAQYPDWTSYQMLEQVNTVLELEEEIWVGTDVGIYIINKTDYSLQHLNKINSELPSNAIEDIIYNEENQMIFIGTYDVALGYWANDSWSGLDYPEEFASVGNDILTYCIEIDNNGNILAGTSEGLLVYDGEEWTKFSQDEGLNLLFGVWDMEKEEDGNVLVSGNVLFRWDGDTINQVSPPLDGPFEQQLFAYGDSEVFKEKDGTIWFFPDHGKVGAYRDTTWSIYDNPTFHGIPKKVFQTEDSTLWLLDRNAQFHYFDGEAWQEGVVPFEGLSEMGIKTLHLSDDVQYEFVGSDLRIHDTQGIQEFTLGDYPFEGVWFNFQEDFDQNLWVRESYTQLLELSTNEQKIVDNAYLFKYDFQPDGKLWLDGGNKIYQELDNGWATFDHTNSILPETYVIRTFTVDANGGLWLGLYEEGLYHYDGTDWKRYTSYVFSNFYFIDAVADHQGGIYLSMWNSDLGNKLYYFYGDDYEEVFENQSFESGPLFYYDHTAERLWLNSYYNIYSWDGQELTQLELPQELDENELIRHFFARGEQLFMSSTERLFIFDGEDWTIFTKENSPLSGAYISGIGLDKEGRLWMTQPQTQNATVLVYQTNFSTALDEVPTANEEQFSLVYPTINTGTATLELDLPEATNDVVISVFNAQGQLLRQQRLGKLSSSKSTEALDLSFLKNKGLYWLEVQAGQRKSTHTIILK